MRYAFIFLAVILSFCPLLRGQTSTQKTLDAEPEMQQIGAMGRHSQAVQNLPDHNVYKPGLLMSAGLALADLRTEMVLLDRLENRLETQTQACNYCALKQDELSELIRQRISIQNMAGNAYSAVDGPFGDQSAAKVLSRLMSATPMQTRWDDPGIAVTEAADQLAGCNRQIPLCQSLTDGGASKLAGLHENGWAKCFSTHNWVQKSSERLAYENCMDANDPLTKLCAAKRKASPDASCTRYTVIASDVERLLNYQDRWITDPNKITAMVTVVNQQPVNVTLLDPVVMPPTPANLPSTGPRRVVGSVRGRLENTLEGAVADNKGRVIVVRPGAEVTISFNISAPPNADSSQLDLQMLSARNAGEQDHQLITGNFYHKSQGWPAAGTVLMPANTPLTFQTACGCLYPMTLAEFKTRAVTDAASGTKDVSAFSPILSGSRIQTVLLEPVDVPGIQASKSFHAQLNVDLELPRGNTDKNAVVLPRGTDIYLKVVDQNATAPFTFGHTAQLSVDYAMLNGQKIPIQTGAWPHSFVVPRPGARQPPGADVLWPKGDTKWFDITEQSQISRQALAGGNPVSQSNAAAPVPSATAPVSVAQDNAPSNSNAPVRAAGGKGNASSAPNQSGSIPQPSPSEPRSAPIVADSIPSAEKTTNKDPIPDAAPNPAKGQQPVRIALRLTTVDEINVTAANEGRDIHVSVLSALPANVIPVGTDLYLKAAIKPQIAHANGNVIWVSLTADYAVLGGQHVTLTSQAETVFLAAGGALRPGMPTVGGASVIPPNKALLLVVYAGGL